MPNWKKAVKQFFKNADPDQEYYHCAEDGAPSRSINAAMKKLKIELPQELRSFYEQFNGVGLTNDETEYPSFIPPIDHLPEFVESSRRVFPKTHKKYANRYLPVVDWENGDTCGYMVNDEGGFIDCLFMFNHELCTHEQAQDVNEFLTPVAENLYEFLSG